MSLPITISISADVVAWYAALVSTGMFFFEFLKYRRERVHVALECKLNYRIYGAGSQYAEGKNYIIIKVINRGIRPVTITTVGFITKNKEEGNGILSDSVRSGSRELTEGKSTDYLMEQDSVVLDKIKYFVAYDMTGREFKGKLKLK